MAKIYMDESGYTGQDLYNSDQQVFVIASTDFSKNEAKELLAPLYEGYQGKELKHSALAKWPKGQKKIVDLVKTLQAQKQRVATWTVHKRFVLLQKFIDIWLEPVMHRTGHDFYASGENIAFCNMLYYCLEGFAGKEFRDKILFEYQKFMLDGSQAAYNRFWNMLADMAKQSSEDVSYLLSYPLIAPNFLGVDHIKELGEKPLDISLTVALNTVSHWRNTKKSIDIIHDESSNMAKDRWIWEALTSPDVAEKQIGYGDHRVMNLPLNVTSTSFEKSETFPQIQLCDLLAGATATWGTTFIDHSYKKEYSDRLFEAGIHNLAINGIWPTIDVEPTTVDENFQGDNPIDTFADIIGDAMNKKNRP
jgi:hypothetical protein